MPTPLSEELAGRSQLLVDDGCVWFVHPHGSEALDDKHVQPLRMLVRHEVAHQGDVVRACRLGGEQLRARSGCHVPFTTEAAGGEDEVPADAHLLEDRCQVQTGSEGVPLRMDTAHKPGSTV